MRSAAARGRVEEGGRGVVLLVRGEVAAGSDNPVDGVEYVGGQHGVRGGELGVQVIHRARADDRAGHGRVRGDEAERELNHGQAGLVGDVGQLLDGVHPGPVGGDGGIEAVRHHRRPVGRDRLALADCAGQPARGQWAPDQDAEAVLLGYRQNVRLDPALQDRVAGLLGDVTAQVIVAGGPLGLDDAVRREGRGAEVTDLAGPLQVGQRRQRLLVAGGRVPAMDLVQIHVVDAQAPQTVVQLGDQPAPRTAPVVTLITHRQGRLGGEHDVVAPPGDGLADHLLRLAGAVHVGGVDEVDAAVERGVDDGSGLVLAGSREGAEVHRAEHEGTDLYTGAPQGAVLDERSPPHAVRR